MVSGTVPENIALAFVRHINEHDVTGLMELTTDDHVFVDAGGRRLSGKDQLRNAWIGYLELFPDYRMEVQRLFSTEDAVALFGSATGTVKTGDDSRSWTVPAAWLAETRDGKVRLWQVYADNEPVRALLEG